MKVAFYGNNLNCGAFFVKALRNEGIEADLIVPIYENAQESMKWWDSDNGKTNFNIIELPIKSLVAKKLLIGKELKELNKVRNILERDYDILMLTEDGPALFGKINKPKLFISQGYDLYVLPFMLRTYTLNYLHAFKSAINRLGINSFIEVLTIIMFQVGSFLKNLLSIVSNLLGQYKQRRGIKQCNYVVITPQKLPSARALKIPEEKIKILTFVADDQALFQLDKTFQKGVERQYEKYDIVFFGPARQFYLPLNSNKYVKDNDKLILGYKDFLDKGNYASKLILTKKGRSLDLKYSMRLITKLGISNNVEWVDEISNIQLRSYYSLKNVVVCDQFNPLLAGFGSIGREASVYGRLIITGFTDTNKLMFGEDMPPHVFSATTSSEISKAMLDIAALSQTEKSFKSNAAKEWSKIHIHSSSLIKKYVKILSEL